MRKKTAFIVISCIFLFIGLHYTYYLQFGRTPLVNNVFTTDHSDGYEMTVSITANKIVIWDKEDLAKQLVRQALDNAFENVMFSYDVLGYPNAMSVTVYSNERNRRLNKPSFSFRYVQDDEGQFYIDFD